MHFAATPISRLAADDPSFHDAAVLMAPYFWSRSVYRANAATSRDVLLDLAWLTGFALLMIATGIGLRDPWPADEPRFALVARDMVATGDWLIPRIGGEVYADKPPLYFWLIAIGLEITGSLRVAFLLPSLVSGIGSVLLTYDLARRLWNRETGLAAGLLLLITVQFVWQARQAQIDATLCLWTTLSLYGLLRHLLIGPAWRWYAIGWAAAGLGVITKGVGFLPLLILIPYALMRSPKWSPRASIGFSWRWWWGCLAFVAAASLWLGPMLHAAMSDPALAAYRDEILFQQTLTRYANAWHHREPFWYFIVQVIPALWLPLTALLPWLLPRWRRAWRDGDTRIALPLCWVVLVIVFFSLSSGKRGVYVLPAVPALVLACAPYMAELAANRIVQRVLYVIGVVISASCWLAVAVQWAVPELRQEAIVSYELDPFWPLVSIAVATGLVCLALRPRRGLLTFAAILACILLVVSFWINPVMNAPRSGAAFVATIEQRAHADGELGLVAFKEQYLLNMRRPVVHFGHARWREAEQEAADAARWLSESATRQLVVGEDVRKSCFPDAAATSLGAANGTQWYLVRGTANPACVSRGVAGIEHRYVPPSDEGP